MEKATEDDLKRELLSRYAQMMALKLPKGFYPACDRIDIDVFEYDSYKGV